MEKNGKEFNTQRSWKEDVELVILLNGKTIT